MSSKVGSSCNFISLNHEAVITGAQERKNRVAIEWMLLRANDFALSTFKSWVRAHIKHAHSSRNFTHFYCNAFEVNEAMLLSKKNASKKYTSLIILTKTGEQTICWARTTTSPKSTPRHMRWHALVTSCGIHFFPLNIWRGNWYNAFKANDARSWYVDFPAHFSG